MPCHSSLNVIIYCHLKPIFGFRFVRVEVQIEREKKLSRKNTQRAKQCLLLRETLISHNSVGPMRFYMYHPNLSILCHSMFS